MGGEAADDVLRPFGHKVLHFVPSRAACSLGHLGCQGAADFRDGERHGHARWAVCRGDGGGHFLCDLRIVLGVLSLIEEGAAYSVGYAVPVCCCDAGCRVTGLSDAEAVAAAIFVSAFPAALVPGGLIADGDGRKDWGDVVQALATVLLGLNGGSHLNVRGDVPAVECHGRGGAGVCFYDHSGAEAGAGSVAERCGHLIVDPCVLRPEAEREPCGLASRPHDKRHIVSTGTHLFGEGRYHAVLPDGDPAVLRVVINYSEV